MLNNIIVSFFKNIKVVTGLCLSNQFCKVIYIFVHGVAKHWFDFLQQKVDFNQQIIYQMFFSSYCELY